MEMPYEASKVHEKVYSSLGPTVSLRFMAFTDLSCDPHQGKVLQFQTGGQRVVIARQ